MNFLDSQTWKDFLDFEILGNTVYEFLIGLGIFLGLFLIFYLFGKYILSYFAKFAAKTKSTFDDEIVRLLKKVSWLFYFVVALYFALNSLNISVSVMKWFKGIFLVVVVYEVIKVIEFFLSYTLQKVLQRKYGKAESGFAFHGVNLLIKIGLFSFGFLFVISNLGFDITSLVASLGITGVAVALAVQNILGDIFSSFSIYLDKPFQVGDFIVIGNDSGIVRKIGLKTTRIESLDGNEIVVSNRELTTVRVQNFKRMKKRRIKVTVAFAFDTAMDKLKKFVESVEEGINKIEGVEFSRCHFKEMTGNLKFEIIYFVLSNDYDVYKEKQQQVNFKIKELGDREKLSFV